MPEPTNPAVPEVKPVGNAAPTPSGGTPPVTPPEAIKPGQPSPGQQGVPPASAQKEVPITALHEERDKRQALESEVADLKRMVSEGQQNQYQQNHQQQQPQHDAKAELEQLWEEDPKKAVRVEIMYAMDWRDRVDSGLEWQADELARRYPDFNNYRSTALGQVRSLPLNQRGGQGILEAAYFMVRGQNTDQIVKQQEADLLERYRRGELNAQGLATPPGSFSTPAPISGVAATQEQINVAGAMGMTVDEYMNNIQVPK